MSSGVECNIMEIYEKFAALSKVEMTKAMKSAVRSGANELKKQTKANAQAGIRSYNNHPNETYNQGNVLDAIRTGKTHDDDGEDIYTFVTIFGNRKPNSKEFRFKFLDHGTVDRYTKQYKAKDGQTKQYKKPKYLGRIKPGNYFENAQNTVIPELERIFMEKIDAAINRINNGQ